MARLQVKLFGWLEVRGDTQSPPAQFPTRKAEQLLCFLLLHRELRHSREQLAALLWADQDVRRGRHCLNTTLWRIRQALQSFQDSGPPYVAADGDMIGINENSAFWLDVDEFERLCAKGRQLDGMGNEAAVQALQQAVALYRGDLLPHCYEDWCLVYRQRLQQMYLAALSRLAAAHTQRRDYTEGIICLQRILSHDPLREEVHRDLIRLYASAERPQDALRQFQICADTLKRELHADPMPETMVLFSELTSHSTKIAPALPLSRSKSHIGYELEALIDELSGVVRSIALANSQAQRVLQRVEQLYSRDQAAT